MRVYLICSRRDGGPRWTLEAVIPSRAEAERDFVESARDDPAALSVLDVGDAADYFDAAYKAGGFDANDSVAEPPGEVLMRSDV